MRPGRSLMLVSAGLVAATLSLPAQGDKVQGTATVGTAKVPRSRRRRRWPISAAAAKRDWMRRSTSR